MTIWTRPSLRWSLILAAAILAVAGVAQAQTAPLPSVALPQYRIAPTGPAIDLAAPRTAVGLTFAQANALREAGIARTSLDRHFAPGGLVGSVGFLCGLQPRLDEASGSAYGLDPHGRFLGAKLSRAF